MAQKNNYNLARTLRELEEVLARSEWTQSMYDKPRAEVLEALRAGDWNRGTMTKIDVRLTFIRAIIIARAGLSILRGVERGWSDIHRAMWYECVRLRMEYHELAARPPDQRGVGLPIDASIALAHALAFDDLDLAHRIAEPLILGVPHGIIGSFSQIGFEPFAVELYGRRVGRDLHNVWPKRVEVKDRYSPVFDAWHDEAMLGTVLLDLCEAHLEYTNVSDDAFEQFGPRPLEIYPVEILAIKQVRARLLKRTPQIDHPLMTSPLARLPDYIPVWRDELLDRVIERSQDVFPGI